MKLLKLFTGLIILCMVSSCRLLTELKTDSVTYQSVRTRYAQPTPTSPIPDEAKIAVAYSISSSGELTAIVYNRTAEIMTIDQTMSFFVDTNGKSTSYYDPTVRTTSTTDSKSKTKGGSVNLGSVADAFGIRGIVGQIAGGVNVGGSGTTGQSVTNATYVADMPRVSLAPHSNGAMSKVFTVSSIKAGYAPARDFISPLIAEQESHCRFSVCISYSVDGGNTFEKLVTDFYADSLLGVRVRQNGKVNDALRQIYQAKPDALYEPWWMLQFSNNIYAKERIARGVLYDYQ